MRFDNEYFNIGHLDRLAYGNTVIHKLDPRAKVVATLFFLVTVVSYPKYEVVRLVPYFIFPLLLLTLSDTPFHVVYKKLLIVSPFAFFIGIFNPVFDPKTVSLWEGFAVSAGWVSFLSILLKFTLTISAALLLIATTSFPGVCDALHRLGAPALFTAQLLFLYRYIFVLAEEAMRMVRARDMRSFGNRGTGVKVYAQLVGILFIRTIERADRIHHAMLCRGFSGTLPGRAAYRFNPGDMVFTGIAILALTVLRVYDVTDMLGTMTLGGIK